jgi:Flp pilus assembly protein TadG
MHYFHTQSGSVAVECVLILPLMVAMMLLVLHVGLLCIQKQVVIYDTFMAMRARLIVTDVTRATQKPTGDNPVCTGGGPC